MARGDQLARQWQIIQLLIGSRSGKAVSDLAAELDCHGRTVYRDLEALQAAGFPLYTHRKEGKNIWRLMDTFRREVPLPLSFTELLALYFSRDLLNHFNHPAFRDSLESLFRKLKAILPADFAKLLDAAGKTLRVGAMPYKQVSHDKAIMEQLNKAILQRHHITLEYWAASRRQQTRRVVAPYELLFFNGTFYLIGYCRLRKDIRIFSLDRIRNLAMEDSKFDKVDEIEIDQLMSSSFGVFVGQPVEVRIRFQSAVAAYVNETVWHGSQSIHQEPDGSVVLEMAVAHTDELKKWILGWGAAARVEKPEALKRDIENEVAALIENYAC
jgi:predicted DNA-binding transcriptional regulator YafY